MFAFLINLIIIAIVMKVFFRYMYPKPPKHFFAQEGDDTTIRQCDYCGNQLATYRGILQHLENQTNKEQKAYFFCNDEHQANFLSGKIYNPNENYDSLPKKINRE